MLPKYLILIINHLLSIYVPGNVPGAYNPPVNKTKNPVLIQHTSQQEEVQRIIGIMKK